MERGQATKWTKKKVCVLVLAKDDESVLAMERARSPLFSKDLS